MMACRATDRVVLTAPVDLWQELGDHKAVGRVLDVLAERPPTEVIDFLDLLIRTLEPWNMIGHPIGRRRIGDGLPAV